MEAQKAGAPVRPPSHAAAPPQGFTPATRPAVSSGSKVDQRIVDHIRSFATNMPPNVDISVVGRMPSKLQGFETVTVEITDGVNTQRTEVLVTSDDKFAVIPAAVFDLSINPYVEAMKKIDTTNAPVWGNKSAKVTIVEYSDFECPKCGEAFHTLENEVMKQYGDRVRLIYKNFPLPGHVWAESAAVAGMCAFQQSNHAFWVLYKDFFSNQATITKDNIKAQAMAAAARAGIDVKKFEGCYDKKDTLSQIQSDEAEGASLNLSGTPLFIVNGRPIGGAAPFSVFQKVIDEELRKVSN